MVYCLNPNCAKPQNPDETKFCLCCGSHLLLKEQYRPIQPLGEGGFGRTFLAEDIYRMNAHCVIKQFFPLPQIQGNTDAMAKATRLFEQEARQLLELGEQHLQIPTLFGYFEQDRRLYLVQQFIDGQDLSQELEQQGAFSEQKIRAVLNDLLPVLQFIHEHQVIHRDIKPTNILRRRVDGKLVLIDFGIAKPLTGNEMTRTGTRAGTEGYAPLEQLRGGRAYPASDLYSLGVTCIRLLTNASLDELYDPLQSKWLWQEYLRQQNRDVSTQMSQVLDKLLKDYVSERYQSANQVLKDLNTGTSSPTLAPTTLVGQCIHTFTTSAVDCVAISPDGQTLVSGGSNNTLELWHLDSEQLVHEVNAAPGGSLRENVDSLTKHAKRVSSVAISPDGQTLASGSADKTIKLWKLGSGQLLNTLTGHASMVNSLTFSPDGQILASGSADNTIKLWALGSGQLLATLHGHASIVNSVAFMPNEQILASGSVDGTVKLWHLGRGERLSTLKGNPGVVSSVAFSPDGQILASSMWDNTIKLWDLGSGQLLTTCIGHSSWVNSVTISPDGQMLASGSTDTTVKLWHLDNGELLHTLIGHVKSVESVVFSLNGQNLASGSMDGTVKIWRCN